MKLNKRELSAGGGSDKFLKFKDRESKSVVLRGEIHEFHIKWVNGRSVDALANEPGAMSRFKVNAVAYEEGKFVARIWEISLTVYNKLCDVNDEYPLEKTKIKITRQGTGTDTEYHVLPLVSQKDILSPAILAQIEAVPLNILDAKPKTQTQDHSFGAPPPESYDDESIPF